VNATDEPRLSRLDDLLGELAADAEAAYEARQAGRARGPTTGIEAVDEALGGNFARGVTTLSGNTATGKSAFALQSAVEGAAACLYVSAEMSSLELLRRIIARTTNTYLGRLKSGELSRDAVLALARQAVQYAPDVCIADATQVAAPPAWIREAAEVTRGECAHLLIVIDSAHAWVEAFSEGVNEYDALNAGLAELRKLAAGLNASILLVAEQNRASLKADSAGDVNSSAGSRRFEYTSEAVLDLHRKKGAQPDINGEVETTLTIAKNRNGASGKPVSLLFHGALQRFR
jgi:replicative DNA helicase